MFEDFSTRFVLRTTLDGGWIELDLLRRAVIVDGNPIALVQREFELLAYLIVRRPEIVPRAELLREVWRLRIDPGTNVVEVQISRLRQRLRRAGRGRLIETVRGRGYRLAA